MNPCTTPFFTDVSAFKAQVATWETRLYGDTANADKDGVITMTEVYTLKSMLETARSTRQAEINKTALPVLQGFQRDIYHGEYRDLKPYDDQLAILAKIEATPFMDFADWQEEGLRAGFSALTVKDVEKFIALDKPPAAQWQELIYGE